LKASAAFLQLGSSSPISVDLSVCLGGEGSQSSFPNSQALYSCSTSDFIPISLCPVSLCSGHPTHLFPLVCFQREVQCSSSLRPARYNRCSHSLIHSTAISTPFTGTVFEAYRSIFDFVWCAFAMI